MLLFQFSILVKKKSDLAVRNLECHATVLYSCCPDSFIVGEKKSQIIVFLAAFVE